MIRVAAPNGNVVDVDTDDEEVARATALDYFKSQNIPTEQTPQEPEQAGIFEGAAISFGRGLETLGEAITDIGSPFRTDEQLAQISEERKREAQEEAKGPQLADPLSTYKEEGLFAALGEAPEFITQSLAGSAPFLAAPIAGGLAGAKAGALLGPVGSAIGGAAGFIGTSALQFFGLNIGRQIEEGATTQEDLKYGRALAAAPLQAGSEYLIMLVTGGLGRALLGKGKGTQTEKLATDFISKLAGDPSSRGITKGLGVGFAKGAPVEGTTEIIQQALERWQAGLELTSDDALEEYARAGLAGAAAGGPLGAGFQAISDKKARDDLAPDPTPDPDPQLPSPEDAPLLLTYQPGTPTDSDPEQVADTVIEELISNAQLSKVEGRLDVAPQAAGGAAVVNEAGEVLTPAFPTFEAAVAARDSLTVKVPQRIQDDQEIFTNEQAKAALQQSKLEEQDALLETARETVTPLGVLSRDTLPDSVRPVLNQIDTQRLANAAQTGTSVNRDGEYTIDEIGDFMERNQTRGRSEILSEIILENKPVSTDPDSNRTLKDIASLSRTKNIKFNDKPFKIFAKRSTGFSDIERMNQVQRNTLYNALDDLNQGQPFDKKNTSIPVISNPFLKVDEVTRIIDRVRRNRGARVVEGDVTKAKKEKPITKLEVRNAFKQLEKEKAQKAEADVSLTFKSEPLKERTLNNDTADAIIDEMRRRNVIASDGRLRRPVQIKATRERVQRPAPVVKQEQLRQKYSNILSAVQERFDQRKKAFPQLAPLQLKFVEKIKSLETGEPVELEADFQEASNLINIATEIAIDPKATDKQNIKILSETLDHEFIHAVWVTDILSDQDKKILTESVKKIRREVPEYDIKKYEFLDDDNETVLTPEQIRKNKVTFYQFAKALYKDELGKTVLGDKDLTPEQKQQQEDRIEQEILEEAIAIAFQKWARGNRIFPPKPTSIFQKIAQFFLSIREALTNAQIFDGSEIFERLNNTAVKDRASNPQTVANRTTKQSPAQAAGSEPIATVNAAQPREGQRLPDAPPKQKFNRASARKPREAVAENIFPGRDQATVDQEISTAIRRDSRTEDFSTGPSAERKVIRNDEGELVTVIGKIGFGDWINKTESILSDAEIAEARQWYPEAQKVYRKYFGDKWPEYLAAWLMANQQASPATAQMNAVRSREQALAQQQITELGEQTRRNQIVSIEDTGPKAGLARERLLRFWNAMESEGEIPPGGAQKLYDFIDSGLLRNTRRFFNDDPRMGKPAVVDVHSLRDVGFVDAVMQKHLKENYNVDIDQTISSSPTNNQYERGGDFLRKLTDHLNDINYQGGGWEPYETQAVGWMATTKFLGKPGQSPLESILYNIRNLSYEVGFGKGAPFADQYPEYFDLPTMGKKDVTRNVGNIAADFARDITGVSEINRFHATGGWLDDAINPNLVEQTVASPEAMTDMANIIGYLLEQTAMFGFSLKPNETTASKLALQIKTGDASKDLLNNDHNMGTLWSKLRERDFATTKKAKKEAKKQGLDRVPNENALLQGYTTYIDENGNSSMLIMFDSKSKQLQSRIEEGGDVNSALSEISEEMGMDFDLLTTYYTSDYVENDWTQEKDGGSYLQRILERYGPDIQQRVKDFKRSELEPALADEITSARLKYGSGQKFSRRAATPSEGILQDGRRVPRDEGQLSPQDRAALAEIEEEEPVRGLPEGQLPFSVARQAARNYGDFVGRSVPELSGDTSEYTYQTVDGERASRIATAFDEMPDTPNDPFTIAAYDALAEETLRQYDFIKDTGLEVEFYPEGVDPYPDTPRQMIDDVVQNNHMYVFPTDAGFGTEGITEQQIEDNPMLRLTDEYISGKPARVNDIFRVVHDYFGHVKEGFGFRASGEDAAFISHSSMYSPLARVALASETRGQNSWVNFGPFGETNRKAKTEDTIFADQKVGVLPEFAINEGLENVVEPVNLDTLRADTLSTTQEIFVPSQKFSRVFPRADEKSRRFLRRTTLDGNKSINWGKFFFDGKALPVRLLYGKNYRQGGGFGAVHAKLHDPDFRNLDTPYISADAAIASLLDAYKPALAAKGKDPDFKVRKAGEDRLEVTWQDPRSEIPIKLILQKEEDIQSGQEFLNIITTYPSNKTLDLEDKRKKVNELRQAGIISEGFSNTSQIAQDTALESMTRGKKGRPVLKLNKATQKFSRGTIEREGPEYEEASTRLFGPESKDPAGFSFLDALHGGAEPGPLFENRWQRFKAFFREQTLNKYEAISILEGLAKKVFGEIYADSSAFAAVLRSENSAAITKMAFLEGVPVYEGGIIKVVKEVDGQPRRGLAQIFEPILEDRLFSQFALYASARRAQRLNDYLQTGLTENDIRLGLQLGRKYPEFEAIFNEYQEWNSSLVKLMVDTGLIKPEIGQQWIDTADYIPYYRQAYEGGVDGTAYFYPDQSIDLVSERPVDYEGVKGSRIPLNADQIPPALKGAGQAFRVEIDGKLSREVYSSFDQARAVAKAIRDRTGNQEVYVNASPRPFGDFLENITRNTMMAIDGASKNIAAQRTMRDMVAVGVGKEIQLPKGGTKPTNVVMVRIDGEDRYFEVYDAFLYNAITSLGAQESPMPGILTMPAQVLRELVTRDPSFMIRNMMRDTLSTWVTSGRNYTPVIDTAKGFADVLRGSTSAESLRLAGVFGGYDAASNPTDFKKWVLKQGKIKYPQGVNEKAASPFLKLWDFTEKLTSASDASTRLAVYERVLRETGNEAQAIFEAQEVINFNRRGASRTIRVLTAAIPFLNARIQGLDVLYRAGVNKGTANPDAERKSFIAKSSFIIGTSVLYYLLASEDEDYKNATPEMRDLNWIIGDLRIPVPFEVGFLFKTVPERIMAYSFGDDVGRDFYQSVSRGLTSTFEITPPQVIRPIGEAIFNYNIFTGREIVPFYQKGLDPEYQKYESTSSLAVELGKALNISPTKIDHVIKGYTGTLGSYALDIGSRVVDGLAPDSKPMPPTKFWYQQPIIRSFINNPNSRGTVVQFYELERLVRQATNTLRQAKKVGDVGKIKEISEERANLIAAQQYVKNIRGRLTKLRTQKNQILRSQLPPDQKRSLLFDIQRLEQAITATVPSARKQIGLPTGVPFISD